MMKKSNITVFALIISLFILFIPKVTYANSFLTPNLVINESGVKFNSSSTENSFKNAQNEVQAINTILKEYNLLITFASGAVGLLLVALFIINFIKLANSKGNPQERQKAITGLIFVGIATAMSGASVGIVTLFFNFV